MVSSALNVKSLDELAALSKAKPGTLSYSALAIPMQITIENWKKKTGADIVFVPSRGGGDMVTGLLTGTTPVAIVGPAEFHLAHPQRHGEGAGGRFGRALAAVSRTCRPSSELGFPNLAPVYFGFVAPAGTPKPIIQQAARRDRRASATSRSSARSG